MKRLLTLCLLTLASLTSCTSETDRMEAGFRTPPAESRPRVWWHWEDGNVTKDGIVKDLEWMHRIGIGGLHHFDASIAIDPVVDKRLVYMDEGWQDAFKLAVHMADSLGMSFGIASSPGWSSTGGPWVSQEDAMKQLVWSSVDVEQVHFSGILPKPEYKLDFYRDIKTIAFRLPESDDAIRAITVKANKERPRWATPDKEYNLALEASEDGRTYTEICRIPTTSAGHITVNIPPTRAKAFRLTSLDGREVPEYTLYTRSRVEHAEEKTGLASPYDLSDFPTTAAEGESFADCGSVKDISSLVAEDGSLEWDVPEGQWRIIRYGYTLTGKQNSPAPKEATGLEVDKLDPEAWNRYFHKYLDMYVDASGNMLGRRGITELLVDSYEAWWQTWTPRMEEEFASRRGYQLLPWMPALSGEIIQSPEATERFLFDWRRTIGELYTANYARIKDYAAEYGLKDIYLESQENGRVYLVDGMDVKKSATVPMSACWTARNFHTEHPDHPMRVADMRESASVAHIYGKKYVANESFTADGTDGGALAYSPAKLKVVADLQFASGINRVYIHESSHQPLDNCVPGLGLRIYGQWFSRHETWAEQAVAWTDYLARTSYMLAQGQNVADILVYYGEDTNITGRYGNHLFPIPDGYNYDFINPTGLFDIKVKDGRIVAPSGASYEMLCLDIDGLPQSEEVRARLEEIKASGAKICDVKDLAAAMAGVAKDVESETKVHFVHRIAGKTDIYWVSKPSDGTEEVTLSFRSCGKAPMCWDAVSGDISPVSYSVQDGRTMVKMTMAPDDAKFIVFSGKKARKDFEFNSDEAAATGRMRLEGWTVEFPGRTLELESLEDYSAFPDEEIKYFSGTASYKTALTLDTVPEKAWIDLGEVHDLAELWINGGKAGILWTRPFKADISGMLVPGRNEIEVKVVNTWANRLIGDEQPGCTEKKAYVSHSFYKADSETFPAGLIGPVYVLH